MSKIFKNTTFYTLSNILPQAVAFILLPLYSQYLSPEEYGIVNAMVVVQAILTIFFSLDIERSIIRMYWDYPEREKTFLGTITIAISTLSLIVLLCSFLLKDYLQLLFKDINFYPLYLFTIIMTFSLTFSLIPKNYYRLKNKATRFFLISFTELVLNTCLILFFLVYKEEGALGVVKAKMYASLILLPLFILITIKHIKLSFDYEILKNCLKFSLPTVPTLFAAWILGQGDRIFIANYLSLHDLGIYSLSKRIAGIVGLISSSFTMAYHPIFFELVTRKENSDEKLKKINNTFIIIIILFGFSLAFLSKELIYLFLNEKYFDAYIYIPPIIITGVIGSISSTVLGAFFQQSKKMKANMFFGVLGSGITILFYVFLIKKIGLWGAIFGIFFSTLIIFILLYNYAKRKCYFLPFNWRGISTLVLIMLFVVIIFNYLFQMDLLVSLIIKTCVTLCFMSYYFYLNRSFIFRLLKKSEY